MSKTIDQRVVEMRFDNAQFEKETEQSMSTLEKLKKSLNLTGASKGLDALNKAAKNNSIPVLGTAAEAVSAKFSAMQVVGITALANLTNSAVNAGKRMVEALTIAPIKDGFQEYEMVLTAVQTTMNATGKTAEEVEAQLKSLDEYADKTIYSTADMLNNLPKFTNAGVELEVATKAMIGIANATALAGGDASKASIAFYNLGQAIGTGYLTRMDYNSINNAGIATLEWKNQMVEAAIAAGTLIKVGEDSYQAGNKTLTLQQLFIDGLQEQWATTDVMLKVFGDYGNETTDIGKRAYAAAQNIKTFTMMMDSLKATAGTGWKETWQLIFGGLDEATKFWTGLTNFLSGIIEALADWRNTLVQEVMGSPITDYFQKVIERINNKFATLSDPIETVVDTLDNFDDVVKRVMNGEFGNAPVRFEKLTEAGYNYAKVQNKVNELMGSSYRHNENLGKSEEKLTSTQKTSNKVRAQTVEELVKLSDAELKALKFNEVEIRALRLLEEQSEKTGIPINELAEDLSKLSGRSLLINSFKNIGNALVTTFTSMGKAWRSIFTGDTAEIIYNLIAGFHKLTTKLSFLDDNAGQLTRTFKGIFAILDILATVTMGPLKFGFKALTTLLGQFDMNILDATAIIGDAIVQFRDWIDATFDLNKIFEVFIPYIVAIGGAINEWVKTHVNVTGWMEGIKSGLSGLKTFIERWMQGLYNTGDIAEYLGKGLAEALNKLKTLIVEKMKVLPQAMAEGIAEFKLLNWQSVPADIAAGFEKGLVWGFMSIIKKIKTFCTNFINAFEATFKIASPSKVMFAIGKFVILGFIAGIFAMNTPGAAAISGFFETLKTSILTNVASMTSLMTKALGKMSSKTQEVLGSGFNFGGIFGTVLGALKTFGAKVVAIFQTLRLDKIAAGALGVGLLILAKKALDIITMFGNPLAALGNLFESIGKAFDGLGKNLKAGAMKKRAQAILIIAAAIAVLVFALLPLTELSWEQLGKAAASLIVLAGVIAALYIVLVRCGDAGKGDVKSTAKVIVIAAALWLVAMSIKKLADISLNANVNETLKMLAVIVGSMAVILIAFGKFVKADKGESIDKASNILVKMAAALLTMTSVVKIVSGFTQTDINKALKFIAGVGAVFFAIVMVSEIAGAHADKAGTMLLKMSIAMLIMTAVVSAAAGFSDEDLKKAHTFVTGVGVLFGLMIAVSKLGGGNADKAGKMLLGVGVAMLLMVWSVKIASGMSEAEIKRGTAAVAALSVLIMGVIAISKLAGQNAMRAGVLLLAFSVALLIMVGIVWIAGKLDDKEALIRGLVVVGLLGGLMMALIAVTKMAKATKQMTTTLTQFIIIIALLVASVIALSFVPKEDLAPATLAIMGLMGAMIALMAATKLTKNTKQMHETLKIMVVIVGLLGATLLALASLKDPESVVASAVAIGVVLLAFATSIRILNKVSRINKTAVNALYNMLVIVGILAILLGAMTIIPNEKIPVLIASSVSLGVLLVAFAGAIKLIDKVSINKSVVGNLKSMLTVVVALGGLLTLMAWLIPIEHIPSLIASSVSISALLLAFSAAIMILGKAGDVKVHYKTLATMAIIAGALGFLLFTMSYIPMNNIPSLTASTVALGALLNAFATAVLILGKAGEVKVDLKVLATMIGIAAGLAALLTIMSLALTSADIPTLIASSIALGVLLNAFSAAIFILSLAGEVKANLEVLGTMTAIAWALGLLLLTMSVALTAADIPTLIASSIALGVLLNAFSAAIFILSLAGEVKANLEVIFSMTAVAGALAILLALMASALTTANIPTLIASSIALGILLNAFAASIFILSLAGEVSTTALVAALAMIPVTAALAVILGKMAELKVEPSITSALSLGIALNAMAVAVGILSLIGVKAVNAIPAVAAMGVVIAELAIIIGAIGALALIPGTDKLLNGGGNILELIGLAIGKFIGGIVKGFAENVLTLLPLIGVALSGFMVGLQPFVMLASQVDESLVVGMGCLTAAMLLFVGAELLAGLATLGGCGLVSAGLMLCGFILAAKPFFDYISTIDESKVAAAKMVAEMILILTAADLIDGIASLFGGSVDFESLGDKLTNFGKAVKAFSDEVTGIDTEAVGAAAAAGEMIATLQSKLEGTGGLKQALFGEKDLGSFAEQLSKFGEAIVGFNNVIVQNGGIDESSVESAARAGKAIAGLQESLYGAGGLKQDIFGEKDLTTFSTQLVAFGGAMVAFNALVKNSPIDEDAVTSAVNAGKLIAGLQSEIENSGGFVQDIFGEKDLSLFSTQIVAFGDAMVDFSKAVSGNIDDEAVTSATNAGLVLAEIQKAIPDDKWFDGNVPIDEFGEKVVGFGEELVKYSEKVVDVDTAAVDSSLVAAQTLLSIVNSLADLDVTGITLFDNVKNIGTTIKAYYDNISEIEFGKVTQSTTSVNKLVTMINNMADIDSSGISSFKTAISNLATTDLDAFVEKFKDTSKFTSAGVNIVNSIKNGIDSGGSTLPASGATLVNKLVSGISSKTSYIISIINKILTELIKTITNKQTTFYNNGGVLITKFADGMKAKTTTATNAINNIINSISSSLKNSHYNTFYESGKNLVTGFANGISENTYKAEAKAKAMANAAAQAAQKVLQERSPSKVGYNIGDYFGIGFVNGIFNQISNAAHAGADMANAAKDGMTNAVSKVYDSINSGIDTQPTIRPVIDLTDVKSGANAISGLLNNPNTVRVLSNAGVINTMITSRNQNGANDDVVTAIDKLRNKLNNIGNTYNTIENLTYGNGSEVADAITLLTRAIKMEGRV